MTVWFLAAVLTLAGGLSAASPAHATASDRPDLTTDPALSYVGDATTDPRFTDDADEDRQSSSFVITGTLVEDDGSPVANQTLSVSLDPGPAMLLAAEDDDEGAEGLLLSGTTTNSEGEFSLPVPAMKDIDQYVDEEGLATLLFMSAEDGRDLLYRQYVRLPEAAGQRARSLQDDEESLPEDEVVSADLSGELTGMTLAVSGAADGISAAAVDYGAECRRVWGSTPWGNYQWKRQGSAIRKWVPVQRAQTGNKTHMTYEWSNTKETYVQTSIDYTYKSAKVTGGYSKSVVSSSGVNFSVGHSIVRDLEVEYDFYAYQLHCSMSGDATKTRGTGVLEYRPYQFKGFNRVSTYRSYYTCPDSSYRGLLSNTLWVSRSNTTTFSGGVSLNGIGVNAKQTNTTGHKKSYVPKKQSAYVCGQNANPTQTEKVSEVN
ncbi:hypothetical protein [Micromonospora sp. NPDC051296]|uniref:hypothetical protein n=1 Tax=Micromonospora sp. NPDC051296 TaxID=3155046 RepID=UPI0034475BCD